MITCSCYCHIFTKGAGLVMIDMLKRQTAYAEMDHAAYTFAKPGLLTLVFGFRIVSEAECKRWETLYGIVAVEDKLQHNVPSTIKFLRDAGIQLWVLTGRQARDGGNYGFFSQLLDQNMNVFHIDVESADESDELLLKILAGDEPLLSRWDTSIIHYKYSTECLYNEWGFEGR